VEIAVLQRLFSLSQKFNRYVVEPRLLKLIRASGFFDESWYLSSYPDVARLKVDPLLHFLHFGGFEGRDPGPDFSSAFYLNRYADVNAACINPLVHYLMYGEKEGRQRQLLLPYRCPVCSKRVAGFGPISSYYHENRSKYGYPFSFDDQETMNAEQYVCPSCSASDRCRLYALYISKLLEQGLLHDDFALLDIAPSRPLQTFLCQIPNIKYQSADKFMEGVDFAVDVTQMDEIPSDSYDMFICSHVLEHVDDDRKALSELFRILKPGGRGILMVPIVLKLEKIDEDPAITDEATRWRRFGQYDHVRLYSKAGFMQRIQDAGFTLHAHGVEHFGEEAFVECGISLKSVLYIGEKSV
jgi:SAM-dependent methyltransferase